MIEDAIGMIGRLARRRPGGAVMFVHGVSLVPPLPVRLRLVHLAGEEPAEALALPGECEMLGWPDPPEEQP